MKRETLQDQLRNYYAGTTPRRETADRLAALASVDAGRPAVTGANRRIVPVVFAGLATAAAILLVASVLVSKAQWAGDQPLHGPDAPVAGDRPTGVPDSASTAKFVAVKFYMEGCPLSEAMDPHFVELASRFESDNILFAEFNITDDVRRKLSRCLAGELGIECAYDDACMSGTVKLIDREHRAVLATASRVGDMPQLETAIAQAVPR